ncbi:MAG: SCP2 sterol-binding domain-containing protein [Clostridiales bacterium]|nr:SCP2 sterol-binding domain-containing protein [Clostridiales bacterium]
MKITVLLGAVPNHSLGLETIVKIAEGVLAELGLEVSIIDLSSRKIPFFDGKPKESVDAIIGSVRESAGVVFATTVQLLGPCAVLQSLLEYLELPDYQSAFESKNCLLLAVSRSGGERTCLDYLSKAVTSIGAFDSIRIGLPESELSELMRHEEKKDIFEKQVEDFFRLVRQNRKFFILAEPVRYASIESRLPKINTKEREVLRSIEKKRKQPLDEIAKKLNLDDFDEKQAKDISEISQFFAKKYAEPKTDAPAIEADAASEGEEALDVKPRTATCRQMTQGLVRHFQSQLAHGLNAVLQLQISGSEPFSGYYTIQNIECSYDDGTALNPDITILSDSNVWRDVLSGKYTAQKAFMIGRLKVRGNFVLLTKFDHLFSVAKTGS